MMKVIPRDRDSDKLIETLLNVKDALEDIEERRATHVYNIPVVMPFVYELISDGCHSFCKHYAEHKNEIDDEEEDFFFDKFYPTYCEKCIVGKIGRALEYGDDPEEWAHLNTQEEKERT